MPDSAGPAPCEPERALALARRHVPGAGEPGVKWLQSGVANSSYSVLRDGCRYGLRIAHSGSASLGVDREWERRVLEQVARAGLAPRVEACLPAEGVLVTRWAEGTSWSPREARQIDKIVPIAALARKIHSVRSPVLARAMTPGRWIDLYRKALGQFVPAAVLAGDSSGLDAHLPGLQQAYQRFGPRPGVLCHSDLHRHNLIQSDDGLIVLDWEYAHVGDPFWDLAGWLSMNDLSGDAAEALLGAYLARAPREEERLRLRVLQWFYDYIALLWIRLIAAIRGGETPADLAERSQVLQERLQAGLSGGSDRP
jgi:thiamine kinase